MKSKSIIAAALLAAAAVTNSAQAITIGFEDMDNTVQVAFLTDAYGFQWTGDFYDIVEDAPHPELSWIVSPASQAIFTGTNAHSGNMFAWSNGGANIQISGPEFTLNSFWARGGWGHLVIHNSTGGSDITGKSVYIQ